MKKWLVLMLAFVIVAASAGSPQPIAAAASSPNFSDIGNLSQDMKSKLDSLVAAGIIQGMDDGTMQLDAEMTRAQMAKVAALIFALENPQTPAKTSKFDDVAAGHWAESYIAAVNKAGIMEGIGGGLFDPNSPVTKEQLATVIVRGLGLDAEAKAHPGIEDETVSDWAKGYVALAIERGLISPEDDGKFGGKTPVIRESLVEVSYDVKQHVDEVSKQQKQEEEGQAEQQEEQQAEQPASNPATTNPTPTTYDPTPSVTVATPTADPAGGTVTANTYVRLSTTTDGASIYYTTDGSTPSGSSTLYTEPIWITSNVTIKAIGIKAGAANSAILTATYTIAEEEEEEEDTTAPSFLAGYPKVSPQTAGSKKAGFFVKVNEDGLVSYVVVPDGSNAPSAEQVAAGQNAEGNAALDAFSRAVMADDEAEFVTAELAADNTPYDIYIVVRDSAGNTSEPVKLDVTTPAAAVQGLTVVSVEDMSNGYVCVEFSAPIDPDRAAHEQNYRFTVAGNSTIPETYPISVDVTEMTVILDIASWYAEYEIMDGTMIEVEISHIRARDDHNDEIDSVTLQFAANVGSLPQW